MGGRSFLFDGFTSPKSGKRRTRVAELMSRPESFVLYESPFRILLLMEEIAAVDPDRSVCLGREMTKIHEEFLTGKAFEVLATLKERGEIKGELAVLVAGRELA
jgi:16S rRNA (cytidine1402-2'-O)-methyltransferase